MIEVDEYLPDLPGEVGEVQLKLPYVYPIKTYTAFKDRSEKELVDPFSALTSALVTGKGKHPRLYQIHFSPVIDHKWKKESKVKKLQSKDLPLWYKRIIEEKPWHIRASFAVLLSSFFIFQKIILGLFRPPTLDEKPKSSQNPHILDHSKETEMQMSEKFRGFGYSTALSVIDYHPEVINSHAHIREMVAALNIFNISDQNGFILDRIEKRSRDTMRLRPRGKSWYFSSAELAGLVHLPTLYVSTPGINWVTSKKFEPPANLPLMATDATLTPIGETNFRGDKQGFGSGLLDRRRHIYIIGKTGMGKSTLLENMIYDDIVKGRGVGLIDPHGDLAETILRSIPKSRTNDVVLFDPTDKDFPIGFNMLESVSDDLRPIVASGLVSVFKRIFGEQSWGPRLEHILRNTVLTLLEA